MVIIFFCIMNKQKHYVIATSEGSLIHTYAHPTNVEEETTQLLFILLPFARLLAWSPPYFFPAAPAAEFTFSTNHSIPIKEKEVLKRLR